MVSLGTNLIFALILVLLVLIWMIVTGLIISLGLLIDNAIVVVEDYKLKRKSGAAIADAINQSVHHLWGTTRGIDSNHGICLYAHRSGAWRCWRLI